MDALPFFVAKKKRAKYDNFGRVVQYGIPLTGLILEVGISKKQYYGLRIRNANLFLMQSGFKRTSRLTEKP